MNEDIMNSVSDNAAVSDSTDDLVHQPETVIDLGHSEVSEPMPEVEPQAEQSGVDQQQVQPQADVDVNYATERAKAAQEALTAMLAQYQQPQQPQQQQQVQQPPQQIQPQQQVNSDVPPNMTEDFIGYMKWIETHVKAANEYQARLQEEQRKAAEIQAYNKHLDDYFTHSLTVAKTKYNDLDAALTHVYNARVNQLKALSDVYPMYKDQSAIDGTLRQELQHMISACAQNGVNPAEALYNVAAQYGYQRSQQPQQQQQQPVQNMSDAVNRVVSLRNHVEASKSLTATNGGVSANPTNSLEALSSVPFEEFEEWYNSGNNKKRFSSLLGG